MSIFNLDNRGFAIMGILYTLFILFLLILLSILSGLSSKKNLLERMTSSYEERYLGTKLSESDVANAKANNIAPVDGKYVFLIEGTTVQCSAYLKKNTSFSSSNITYVPNDCNTKLSDYGTKMRLQEIYRFEKE